MEQVNLVNLMFAFVISALLVQYWKVVLGVITIVLVGLAVLGFLSVLFMLGLHWP